MNEVKEYKQFNATCTSTEEYMLLVEKIREQGGYITHTFTLKDHGQGISVQYLIPKISKEVSPEARWTE